MALDLQQMGKAARQASRQFARVSTDQKNAALYAIADALDSHSAEILEINAADVEAGRANGLDAALLDRLSLKGRLAGIAEDVRAVAKLPDPIGEIFDVAEMSNGLHLRKQRTPLGVLGVIYEARPNVTVDVAALALKTSNAAILRGGKETLHSNIALIKVIQEALAGCGLPAEAIQFISDTDRKYIAELLRLYEYVDMIIPRGGAGLHKFCRENSNIPVITGGIGIVHMFVDESADLDAALPVIHNAKVQRPSVCNALDTLLVHQQVAQGFIPRVIEHLSASGVSFRLDPRAQQLVTPDGDRILPAGENDWDTEWMALILGIRVVDDLDQALEHIDQHSSWHSEAILTANENHAARFVAAVDSAAVFVNASTRFNDGGQFGLGAEIAVSTQKIHARGPMGLRELTSYKWVAHGDYHVRK
ncbi:MAG: glutamate-5-semialdehyde dehydrogenase [Anaerolineae bacterium]|nr:glutamate-5-semialdehyde dehydrogenase [Anaerolineae bacterium]